MKFGHRKISVEKEMRSRGPPKRRGIGGVAALAFMGILPLISRNANAQEDLAPPPKKPGPEQVEKPLEGPPRPEALKTDLDLPSWIFAKPLEAGWGQQEKKEPGSGGEPPKKKKGGRGNEGGESDASAEGEVFAPCGMPKKEEEERGEEPKRKKRRMRIGGGEPLDLGMNFIGNEAGEATFMRLARRNSLKLDAGSLAFWSDEASIYGRLLATPQAKSGGFKAKYYGSYGFVYNMPSWFYSSHAGAIGHAHPVGKNSLFRIGGMLGGAFSLPANDDLYMNLALGMSLDIAKKVLLYWMPTAYMNTDVPMANSYIGCFKPKIDRVEMGLQVAPEGMPSIAAFAKIGWIGLDYGISNEYGLKATHEFRIKNGSTNPEIGIWASAGITQWSPYAWNGFIEPALSAGMTLSFMGAAVKSTNSIDISRMQGGETGMSKADIDYLYMDEITQRILTSESFEEFAAPRGKQPIEDTLNQARYLGGLLHENAFIRGSREDNPKKWSFINYRARQAAQVGNEDTFQFLKRYMQWRTTHGEEVPLPEYFKEGIVVCTGIHWLVADFLRKNGVDAKVVSVATPDGPHAIVAARLPDRIVLLNYGERYDTKGTLDEAIRFYGKRRGAYPLNPSLSGPGGYIGTYVTPEGRLVHKAFGLEGPELLKKDFLGVK